MATEPSAAQRIAAAIDRAEMKAKLALELMGSFEESFTWDQWIDDDEFRVGTDIKHFILANDPAGVLRRCAADRRVLERHQPINEHPYRKTKCRHQQSHGVSWIVDWPCDEIRDLADRWGVEIGDQT